MSDFQPDPPPRRPGPPRRPAEGVRRVRRPRDDDYEDDYDDRDAVETLIPYRNPPALVSYYLGVFGLIPILGLLLGPAALIVGIVGLRKVKQHRRAGGTGHAITGIVLGTLATLGNYGCVIFILLGAFLSKK
jgi:hypothetical protein